VLGLTGVVIALIVLTIMLAGVFLVRPSITAGATGKVLAFVGLCVLPALCIGTGMSFHMQRSQQTAYCISCHSMETHGESLHLEGTQYIPAQHFQNHLVPPDAACYTCHTDYTMYGPLKDKLKGLTYLYMEYVSTPPKTIHIDGKYSNLQCLHCHQGARNFEEHLNQMPPIGELTTNGMSCLSSGCHDMIHNASEVGHLKMWNAGATSTALASGASSPAPAKAEPVATGPSKAGSTAGGARAAEAKAVFDSHGCAGCHGESGAGGSGPALTHVSSQYPPAKLTAVLKVPTAKMKAAGMVPLTLSAADMKGLVSYVSGLGGTPASAATSSSPGASAPAPAKAEPVATAETSKTPAGSAAGGATTAGGKSIFDSHGCAGCHGESGAGGSGPALTDVSSKYPPAKLTAVLKAPTAGMKAAGMVPLTLNAADMKELVSYVTSLGGKSASAAPPPSSGAPPTAPAPAKAEPDTTGTSKVKTGSPASAATIVLGKSLYHSHGCGPCHGATGAGGAGPALTHISDQYPPAKLTAILTAPSAGMKAAGMIPVTLNAADMEALVSYVTSLGGTSASAPPPASGASSPAPAKPEPDAKAGTSNAQTGDGAGKATDVRGKDIFDSQGCGACHGESGTGGSGPALTNISSQYPPAKLTAILKAPTASMKAAGMIPLTLNAADMKELVSYVSSLGGK
jgi:mono/diheme cytochrome c family protein